MFFSVFLGYFNTGTWDEQGDGAEEEEARRAELSRSASSSSGPAREFTVNLKLGEEVVVHKRDVKRSSSGRLGGRPEEESFEGRLNPGFL